MRATCLVALIAAGCAPPPPPPTPAMQVALTVDSAADGTVPLISGAQGGFHVWLQYTLSGAAPDPATLQRRAERLSDHQPVLHLDSQLVLPDDASATIPMFMCPTPVGLSIIDEPLRLALAVVDADGHELGRAEVDVVPTCPSAPQAQADFCRRICSGG